MSLAIILNTRRKKKIRILKLWNDNSLLQCFCFPGFFLRIMENCRALSYVWFWGNRKVKVALCRRGATSERLIALIRLSSPPILKKRSFVHPDLKLMAYFIASKCFAAKTGFPNRSCEVARSGSWPSIFSRFTHVLKLLTVDDSHVCVTSCQPRPGQSQRVWESDGFASGPAGEPFSYLYKNSFCTVLLRGKRFWYLVILQSHLAAFVFLCQSC